MKTVAIVGSHSKARETAPFDDLSVDIWVFNAVAGIKDTWVKRADAVFQMHQPEIYRSPHNREDSNHWRWLQKQHPFPIYMIEKDPLVPSSITFPLEAICDEYLPGWRFMGERKEFFSSSIEYALALAIRQGYERIELHGIEMSSDTEYSYQRVGLALWVGIALGRGVQVEHYGGNKIFDRPLYGYAGNLKHDAAALEERLAELRKSAREAQTMALKAEMQLGDYYKDAEKLPKVVGVFRETKKRMGFFQAAHDEIERYLFKVQAAEKAGKAYYIDRNEHEEAAYTAQKDCDGHDRQMKETAGAINLAMQSYLNTFDPNTLRHLKKFIFQHVGHAEDLGRSNGILTENLRLMKVADLAITAAGGEKALEIARTED